MGLFRELFGASDKFFNSFFELGAGRPAPKRAPKKKLSRAKRTARKSSPAPVADDLKSALYNQGFRGAVLTAKVKKGLAASRTDLTAAFKGAMS